MTRCSRALLVVCLLLCAAIADSAFGVDNTIGGASAANGAASPTSAAPVVAVPVKPAPAASAPSPSAADVGVTSALAAALEPVFAAPEFKHSHWGLLVVDPETCRTLYDHNGDKLFAPASVTKLFSVAAALDELGGDYRFETPVYRRGDVEQDGVLDGDLVLVASGDPNLGGRAEGPDRIAMRNTDHT